MSKFASLLENVEWETGSNNGISLQFVNDDASKADDGSPLGLIRIESYSLMEELEKGCDLHKVLNAEGDACSSERSCGAEDAALKGRYRTHCSTKLARSVGEYGSHVGSPMTSTNHSYGDEDVDFANECNRGCGIASCWSRTPKYRGSNQSSNVEEHPLLSSNGERNVVTPSHETVSRSLSQKFRPKSFDELVGQEVVVKCLLSTILRGRITSLYLFHGPRGTELEKLPRNVLSRSQKYPFSKVCDVDISNKLANICIEEGIDLDQGAVDFIASKSEGSLRDAEIMLDQFSLLGKRITTSLAYKLGGVVSDDELLDLALSSDTSNTVIRARESL